MCRWTAEQTHRYHAVRHSIRARMRSDGLTGRITRAEVVRTLQASGFDRSDRYVRAVLSGEKTSRPALREIAAAVRRVRERRREAERLPDWL